MGAFLDPLDRELAGVLSKPAATKLQRAFGMRTVGDLLLHLPRRYATRGELTSLRELRLGEPVTVVAEVVETTGRSTGKRAANGKRGHITTVKITDGQAVLDVTFFNQPFRERDLRPGVRGIFSGTVTEFNSRRQLSHPSFAVFDRDDIDPERWANEVIPLYPASSTVASAELQRTIQQVLSTLPEIEDPVPAAVRKLAKAMPMEWALRHVHEPDSVPDGERAKHALRVTEAFVLQSAILQRRASIFSQLATERVAGDLLARFDSALPFALTDDQIIAGMDIAADLAIQHPMQRLVQGEVGSGKTLVALRAILTVAESGGQSAMLAPTEVLAGQHFRSIVALLGPELIAIVRPVLLTGNMPAADRRRALLQLAAGQSLLVVGTHALLSDTVTFAELALVIVDEQHRFGVEQRETLRAKGMAPHTLVLTATPIPRTIAMTAFGDLDISTIRTLPAGRAGTTTHVVAAEEQPHHFARIWERVAEEVRAGRQVFVVCPAIDASTVEGAQVDEAELPKRPPSNVVNVAEHLRAHPALKGMRIATLTGRDPGEQKDATMRALADGQIDILVATTVVEVGVDVPNASTMVVMDAERFGISQLHQLRGRVGRGAHPGLCLLVTFAEPESVARERIDAVAATTDGFELAERDLELRREGDVLGTAQAGARSSLRVLRVSRDLGVIQVARQGAEHVIADDPELERHPVLRRWMERDLDESRRRSLSSG